MLNFWQVFWKLCEVFLTRILSSFCLVLRPDFDKVLSLQCSWREFWSISTQKSLFSSHITATVCRVFWWIFDQKFLVYFNENYLQFLSRLLRRFLQTSEFLSRLLVNFWSKILQSFWGNFEKGFWGEKLLFKICRLVLNFRENAGKISSEFPWTFAQIFGNFPRIFLEQRICQRMLLENLVSLP